MKTISPEKLDGEISKKIHNFKDWEWTGVDLVRIENVDHNGKAHPNYCVDCFYLIHIEPSRNSEGSILIPTPGVEVPIATDYMIKDLLLKEEKIIYRIFTADKIKF